MEQILRLLKRVRWTAVLGVAALITITLTALIAAVYLLPSGSSVKGNVKLAVSAKPDRIKQGDTTDVLVEVKNLDKHASKSITLSAETYDEKFVFTASENTSISKAGVKVGPQETRRIKFEARAMPGILPGRFRVDVEARQSTPASPAKDNVYVTVKED